MLLICYDWAHHLESCYNVWKNIFYRISQVNFPNNSINFFWNFWDLENLWIFLWDFIKQRIQLHLKIKAHLIFSFAFQLSLLFILILALLILLLNSWFSHLQHLQINHLPLQFFLFFSITHDLISFIVEHSINLPIIFSFISLQKDIMIKFLLSIEQDLTIIKLYFFFYRFYSGKLKFIFFPFSNHQILLYELTD